MKSPQRSGSFSKTRSSRIVRKKAWIREKLNDGYTRSPFALSKAIDCRADRRIIKLRILSALLVLLSGLLTLTDILPIPGYITLVVLMLFWPMHLEGKSAHVRMYELLPVK